MLKDLFTKISHNAATSGGSSNSNVDVDTQPKSRNSPFESIFLNFPAGQELFHPKEKGSATTVKQLKNLLDVLTKFFVFTQIKKLDTKSRESYTKFISTMTEAPAIGIEPYLSELIGWLQENSDPKNLNDIQKNNLAKYDFSLSNLAATLHMISPLHANPEIQSCWPTKDATAPNKIALKNELFSPITFDLLCQVMAEADDFPKIKKDVALCLLEYIRLAPSNPDVDKNFMAKRCSTITWGLFSGDHVAQIDPNCVASCLTINEDSTHQRLLHPLLPQALSLNLISVVLDMENVQACNQAAFVGFRSVQPFDLLMRTTRELFATLPEDKQVEIINIVINKLSNLETEIKQLDTVVPYDIHERLRLVTEFFVNFICGPKNLINRANQGLTTADKLVVPAYVKIAHVAQTIVEVGDQPVPKQIAIDNVNLLFDLFALVQSNLSPGLDTIHEADETFQAYGLQMFVKLCEQATNLTADRQLSLLAFLFTHLRNDRLSNEVRKFLHPSHLADIIKRIIVGEPARGKASRLNTILDAIIGRSQYADAFNFLPDEFLYDWMTGDPAQASQRKTLLQAKVEVEKFKSIEAIPILREEVAKTHKLAKVLINNFQTNVPGQDLQETQRVLNEVVTKLTAADANAAKPGDNKSRETLPIEP